VKVAYLASADSIHTQRWVNEMEARGHEIHLLSQQAPMAGYRPGVTLHRLPIQGPAGYFLNAWRARRVLSRIRPALVHAHYASGYGTLARLAGRRPCLLSVWGSDVTDFPTRSSLRRRLLTRNLRWPDRVAATSQALRDHAEAVVRTEAAIAITPFGVDCEAFRPAVEPRSGPLTLGTVKALAPQYGIDVLVRAFRIIVSECAEPVKLLIVGGGPEEARLRSQVAASGLTGAVEFAGAVPHAEVPGRLRRLDLFFCLSRWESFGVAAVEASACSLPVIVSDVGGLPEVVRDGRTGYVVPKDDARAAADRALRLIRDPDLRRTMGNAGRELVLAEYEWGRCADRMEALYGDLVRHPPPSIRAVEP